MSQRSVDFLLYRVNTHRTSVAVNTALECILMIDVQISRYNVRIYDLRLDSFYLYASTASLQRPVDLPDQNGLSGKSSKIDLFITYFLCTFQCIHDVQLLYNFCTDIPPALPLRSVSSSRISAYTSSPLCCMFCNGCSHSQNFIIRVLLCYYQYLLHVCFLTFSLFSNMDFYLCFQ